MQQDLRSALFIALVLATLAELAGLTGIAQSAHSKFYRIFIGEHNLFNTSSILVHIFILFLFSGPSRQHLFQVLGGGVVIAIAALFINGGEQPLWYSLMVIGGGPGLAALAHLVWQSLQAKADAGQLPRSLLAVGLILVPMFISTDAWLGLTTGLHPAIFDHYLYHFDGQLGFQPSVLLSNLFAGQAWLKALPSLAYYMLPFGFSAVIALQLSRGEPGGHRSFLLFILVSSTLAWLFYHLLPVTGPLYAFGEAFPNQLPATVPLETVVVTLAPRNGVPSMHFAWALAIWFYGRRFGRVYAIGFAIFALLNILATLGLGEHYLADLMLSLPLVLVAEAICRSDLNSHAHRLRALYSGLAALLGWCLILRLGSWMWLTIGPLFWLLLAATQYPLWRQLQGLEALPLVRQTGVSAAQDQHRRPLLVIGAMFLVSGFAAIVYQVLFAKLLANTFGSQSTATYTVLATYMGGMALGAWIGGRIGSNTGRPLAAYALAEVGIAIYCALTPLIFPAVHSLYLGIAQGSDPAAGSLVFWQLLLGGGAMLVPTMLMGMTLPILARRLTNSHVGLGAAVGRLYMVNTLGAGFGALLTGYFILPTLGMDNTLWIAVVLNLVAAWMALLLYKHFGEAPEKASAPAAWLETTVPLPRSHGWATLVVLLVGGGVTLALEVNYIQLLAIVVGNSTYAFSLMLFTFLVGLAVGAQASSYFLRPHHDRLKVLANSEFLLAAAIVIGLPLWQAIPGYFASFSGYSVTNTFATRELIRGTVSFLMMFPPAFFIGFIYPIAIDATAAAFRDNHIRVLGGASALNTLGNIAGVLLAGFLFLPAVGSYTSVTLLFLVSLGLGLMLLMVKGRDESRKILLAGVAGAVAYGLLPGDFNYTQLASGANVYFTEGYFGQVIDHAESLDGGLTTVHRGRDKDGRLFNSMLTNGKFQGNDNPTGEFPMQVGYALIPLLHTQARDRAMLIGYGTGTTARILHEAGFANLDIVELSKDIIDLADRHFTTVNRQVIRKPGVNVHVTDGRNFLALSPHRYDVISIQVTSIWFAGAASLYNREFYQLAKSRLKETGVISQWMQLHHTTPVDVLYIIGSMRSEFRYVWIYLVGTQSVVVGSNNPNPPEMATTISKITHTPALAESLQRFGNRIGPLPQTLLLAPNAVDDMLSKSSQRPQQQLVSTDNNLVLEYRSPRGNTLSSDYSFKLNHDFLAQFSQRKNAGQNPANIGQ